MIKEKIISNYTRPICQLLHHQETKLGLSLHFKEIKPTEVKDVAKWVREQENILQNHPLIWKVNDLNFIAHLETKFTMSIGGTSQLAITQSQANKNYRSNYSCKRIHVFKT